MKTSATTSSGAVRGSMSVQWLLTALLVTWAGCSAGSTIVLDSFLEGDFSLSLTDPKQAVAVQGPIGTSRVAAISSRLAAQGTRLSSSFSATTGTLSFSADGLTIDSRALYLRMTYVGGGPYNLLGQGSFEFDFSSVRGTGFIIIELGRGSDTYGPEVPRIPITTAGTLTFPFDSLTFGTNGGIESFEALHITFEAESEQFSFTLDEIRIVPEPGPLSLFMVGIAARLGRRRRRDCDAGWVESGLGQLPVQTPGGD